MQPQQHKPVAKNVLNAAKRYALQAGADLQRFDSEQFERLAHIDDWQVWNDLLEEYCVRRFDLFAEWMLFASVSPDPLALNPLYEKYLLHTINQGMRPWLSEVLEGLRADIREEVTSRINLRVTARKLYWLAQAKNRLLAQALIVSEKREETRPTAQPLPELPPKVSDLSVMFQDAKLAARQAEIASLAWEHGMKRAAIARRLNLDWSTVDESLKSSQRRINFANIKGKAAAHQARHDPEKLSRSPRR
jgi:hypothetical protein